MSRITSQSYDELLWRLETSSRHLNVRTTNDSTAHKTFGDILSNAQTEVEKPNELSNIEEKKEDGLDGTVAPENVNLHGQNDPAMQYCTLEGMKSKDQFAEFLPNIGVNRATTDVQNIDSAKPPSIPHIAKVARVYSDNFESAKGIHRFDKSQIEEVITQAGKNHGLDPALTLAVANAESSFQPNAISDDGHFSKGLFQLLDTTAEDMRNQLGVSASYQPFNPLMNSHLGVGYLRKLHDIFSVPTQIGENLSTHAASSAADLEKLAVAAFNTGEGNVAIAQRRAKNHGSDPGSYDAVEPYLSPITREYVQKVSTFRNEVIAKNTKSFAQS